MIPALVITFILVRLLVLTVIVAVLSGQIALSLSLNILAILYGLAEEGAIALAVFIGKFVGGSIKWERASLVIAVTTWALTHLLFTTPEHFLESYVRTLVALSDTFVIIAVLNSVSVPKILVAHVISHVVWNMLSFSILVSRQCIYFPATSLA